MKIVFFGLGSIGLRYVEIILRNKAHEIYAFRSGKGRQKNINGVKEISSWKEFERIKPELVFITNPTAFHIKTAIDVAKHNCALYIEKPVGCNLIGLTELLNIVRKKKMTTYIAYNLRFHSVIEKLKKYCDKYRVLHGRVVCRSYLPNWRQNQDYKKSYSVRANMGGGVILDLSHELDYVSQLFGGITAIDGDFGRRSNLTVDAEDYADMMITTKKCPVTIHMNYMSHYRQRTVQIDFSEMTAIGDLINNTIKIYKQEKLTKQLKFKEGIKETYEKELEYFFDNIANPRMMNNLIDASELFHKIIAFKNKK